MIELTSVQLHHAATRPYEPAAAFSPYMQFQQLAGVDKTHVKGVYTKTFPRKRNSENHQTTATDQYWDGEAQND